MSVPAGPRVSAGEAAPVVRPLPRTPRAPRVSRRALVPYMFVGPFMLLFVGALIVPLGYALYLSFFREQLVGGTVLAGMENYTDAFADPLFRAGVLRMVRFLFLQVPIMLGLALLIALALDSGRLRFARTIRLGVFLPYAVPSVVAALMWGYLYGPEFGPFAQLAEAVGLPAPGFLTDSWMLASLANIVSWEFIGYNMIILFAALQAVPRELYEAAEVDGAGPVKVAWHIKIPSIRGALLVTVIFSVIGSFQLFNEPQILSVIAPNVIGSGYTPNLYAYNLAFTNQQINYSAAVSFMLGLVTIIMACAVFLVTSRRSRMA
jgi:multiple sugar transport system permease protein